MKKPPHLWLALSPHGYGHAAMTAPIIREIQERQPNLRLTIQTGVPKSFLDTRYRNFDHVGQIPDFGFRMLSSTRIDLKASLAGYQDLAQNFAQLCEREAGRLRQGRPDLILANVPFVTLAAAKQAGIPAIAFSSLNWLDMFLHYFGEEDPAHQSIIEILRYAYGCADVFLQATPSQPMTVPWRHVIGPVAQKGQADRPKLNGLVQAGRGMKIGLVAFGGIDHALNYNLWPMMPDWTWIMSAPDAPSRPDFRSLNEVEMEFSDVLASVDVVLTKPGYGTFSEAGLSGIPVLYQTRPDWPETAPLEAWLSNHTRSLPMDFDDAGLRDLPEKLHKLFSLPIQPVATPAGVRQGAEIILDQLLACHGS